MRSYSYTNKNLKDVYRQEQNYQLLSESKESGKFPIFLSKRFLFELKKMRHFVPRKSFFWLPKFSVNEKYSIIFSSFQNIRTTSFFDTILQTFKNAFLHCILFNCTILIKLWFFARILAIRKSIVAMRAFILWLKLCLIWNHRVCKHRTGILFLSQYCIWKCDISKVKSRFHFKTIAKY